MLKTAVFDCAIGGKCCSVDGRRYLPSFFRPTQGDLTAQELPPPGIYHPRPKWWGGGGRLGAAGVFFCEFWTWPRRFTLT